MTTVQRMMNLQGQQLAVLMQSISALSQEVRELHTRHAEFERHIDELKRSLGGGSSGGQASQEDAQKAQKIQELAERADRADAAIRDLATKAGGATAKLDAALYQLDATRAAAAVTSDGVAVRAEAAAARSEGGAIRSEGAATRSEGAATRSEGAATRSEGAATRSEGAATRSDGAATRAERAVTMAEGGSLAPAPVVAAAEETETEPNVITTLMDAMVPAIVAPPVAAVQTPVPEPVTIVVKQVGRTTAPSRSGKKKVV
jgi:chromosome segregation ATPase